MIHKLVRLIIQNRNIEKIILNRPSRESIISNDSPSFERYLAGPVRPRMQFILNRGTQNPNVQNTWMKYLSKPEIQNRIERLERRFVCIRFQLYWMVICLFFRWLFKCLTRNELEHGGYEIQWFFFFLNRSPLRPTPPKKKIFSVHAIDV